MSDTPRTKEKETPGETAIGCLLLIILTPVGDACHAIALSTMWRWFVLPTFPTAPRLSAPVVAGLIIVAQLATLSWLPFPAGDTPMLKAVSNLLMKYVAIPAILFFAGWVIKAVWL